MVQSPEFIPIRNNDISVRKWTDLKKSPIASMRHFHCALIVASNSERVGAYHHPASDSSGKSAKERMARLKSEVGDVHTSCIVHRSGSGYSQLDLLRGIEKDLGIRTQNPIAVDLSEFYLEDTPIDVIISDQGILSEQGGTVRLLVPKERLK